MQMAFDCGQYADALKIARNYLKKVDAYDWDAMIMEAHVLSLPHPKFCDYFRAIGIAHFALNHDRTDARRWAGLARVFYDCGIHNEAERCYRTALNIDPHNDAAIIGLCALEAERHPDVGIPTAELKNLLEGSIARGSDDWALYLYLARIVRAEGDKTKAIQMYESAMQRCADKVSHQAREEFEKEVEALRQEIGR